MPWKIEEQDGKFCVVKEADGSTEKCYDDKGEAEDYLKALYASEDKAVDDENREPQQSDEEVADPEAEGETPATEATVNVPTTIRKLTLNIGEAPAEKALFERIWEGVKERLGWKEEDLATGFKVAGNHWLAVYSNNFQDRDKELFTEAAIDRYIERVDAKTVPLPELWVWHAGKNTAIGSADWIGRHGHFTMAAGQFYGGEAAKAAKSYYARHAKDTGISHGFTFPASQFDGKHFHEFNTFEISLLPRGAEANWYTSLEGVKEMALNDEKQKYMEEVFGKEHAARILADWDKRGKTLEENGVDYKAAEPPQPEAAAKEATEAAQKEFGVLLEEVIGTNTAIINAAFEAVKQAKASEARSTEAMQQVDLLRKESDLRPRIASQDADTAIDTAQGKGKELLETIQKQMVETDKFWGTTVVKS